MMRIRAWELHAEIDEDALEFLADIAGFAYFWKLDRKEKREAIS